MHPSQRDARTLKTCGVDGGVTDQMRKMRHFPSMRIRKSCTVRETTIQETVSRFGQPPFTTPAFDVLYLHTSKVPAREDNFVFRKRVSARATGGRFSSRPGDPRFGYKSSPIAGQAYAVLS